MGRKGKNGRVWERMGGEERAGEGREGGRVGKRRGEGRERGRDGGCVPTF
jgi:hypothetical protein